MPSSIDKRTAAFSASGSSLRQSARALQDVARDHKDFGARIGLLAVLQTWTRDLRFHPHVHCVVPASGLSTDGLRWVRPKHPDYFLPQVTLARRFRTRFQAVLKDALPEAYATIPASVWTQDWVVDVQPVGSGPRSTAFSSAAPHPHLSVFLPFVILLLLLLLRSLCL